jgi:hypothetical protein
MRPIKREPIAAVSPILPWTSAKWRAIGKKLPQAHGFSGVSCRFAGRHGGGRFGGLGACFGGSSGCSGVRGAQNCAPKVRIPPVPCRNRQQLSQGFRVFECFRGSFRLTSQKALSPWATHDRSLDRRRPVGSMAASLPDRRLAAAPQWGAPALGAHRRETP